MHLILHVSILWHLSIKYNVSSSQKELQPHLYHPQVDFLSISINYTLVIFQKIIYSTPIYFFFVFISNPGCISLSLYSPTPLFQEYPFRLSRRTPTSPSSQFEFLSLSKRSFLFFSTPIYNFFMFSSQTQAASCYLCILQHLSFKNILFGCQEEIQSHLSYILVSSIRWNPHVEFY